MRVAVVGAGISGLGAAITLAHDGHDVVVLERDATPLPNSPDDAFEWNRRGAPQVRHSHAFLARGRNLIRDRIPELRDAVLAAGATEVSWAEMVSAAHADYTPEAGDDDLVMLACRRTTFEWAQRKIALGTERVELRDGVTVTGLASTNGGPIPRVTGVETSAGTLEADLVIDAMGRPSQVPQFLRAIRLEVDEDRSDANIVYLSRFYHLRDGVEPPSTAAFSGIDLGDVKVGIIRGDNRTFSVTLAYFSEDEPMRRLKDRFDEALRLIPAAQPWVDPDTSEQISPVHYMGGLINRVRHFVRDGEPIVLGLYALGDSSVCTNPLYGRGCSLALVHAALLADAIREHTDDARSVALAFDDMTERELVPWCVTARAQDKVALQIHRGEQLSDFDSFIRSLVTDGLLPAAGMELAVSRAWMRAFNLLTQPNAVFTDPEVMRIVLEYWNERENREPEPTEGPSREEILAAIS